MKIHSISVFQSPPSGTSTLLISANEVGVNSDKFIKSFSDISRTENGCTAYVYTRGGAAQLAAVIITDEEYPEAPVFSLLDRVLVNFAANVPPAVWDNPATISFPELATYIPEYQDPDAMARAQQQLEETNIRMRKPIESVLQRGEGGPRDDSARLSVQAKMFYKTAKKRNTCNCCVLM
ncbi:snare protein YKT6 [Mycena vulgaris]|nr:snare protein YKT6 [Mycena vulgaris]